MRIARFAVLCVWCAASATYAAPAAKKTRAATKWAYPATRVGTDADVLFGQRVADPYRWLEDGKSPEVQAWMKAQDAMTRAELAKFTGRAPLEARLRELLYVDAVNLPSHHGARYFYSRNHADREKSVYYWREGLDGAEHVLIDANQLSADGSTSLGFVKPSWDGKRVAYSLKINNSDESVLHVMNVDDGGSTDSTIDTIDGARYADPQWTPQSDGFYYTYLPPLAPGAAVADRPGTSEIRFHALGTSPKLDLLVHPATNNPRTFQDVTLARDGKMLLVGIRHGWNAVDYYYKDPTAPNATFSTLIENSPNRYEIEAVNGKLYIYTNEGAPHYRVFVADYAKPLRNDWSELIPKREDTMTSVSFIGGALVATYLHNATSQLAIYSATDGKLLRKQELPGLGTLGNGTGGASGISGEIDSDELFYMYQSFVQPRAVYRTSVKTPGTTLFGSTSVKVDASAFTVEQVWYPSKDGTKISMFVVTKKGAPRDGSVPFLLTGYGGFNISRTPVFLGSQLAWLEAGGGYALPNLRGGGEYGEEWHKAGMQANKQNVFDDFAAAAHYLIRKKYTSAAKLAIRGGSNGGLLVGAAMTQHPELYRAVICAVPLLDMVRYHLFGSGMTWIPEYGSAATQSELETLFAYSPYHHVRKAAYPALLMLSADSDDRVDPMHARKFTAMVQANTTSSLPSLLRIEKHSGHGGADLVKQTIELEIDVFAFLQNQLGLE